MKSLFYCVVMIGFMTGCVARYPDSREGVTLHMADVSKQIEDFQSDPTLSSRADSSRDIRNITNAWRSYLKARCQADMTFRKAGITFPRRYYSAQNAFLRLTSQQISQIGSGDRFAESDQSHSTSNMPTKKPTQRLPVGLSTKAHHD
jgi:hypothetical protein